MLKIDDHNGISPLPYVLMLLVIFSVISPQYGWAVSGMTFKMHVGQVKVIPVDQIDRVAIGRPGIVNYEILDNGQLLLIAAQAGETYVHIWEHRNREIRFIVDVTERNMSKQLEIAKQLSRDIAGLQLREVDGRIVFEGEVSAKEQNRIAALLDTVPNAVPLLRYKDFDMEKMVRVDVRIVEISKTDAEQLGIKWQDSIIGPTVGVMKRFKTNDFYAVTGNDSEGLAGDILSATPNDHGFYGYLGLATSITSRIDLLAEDGNARILASPKLVARHGEKAAFHSGGEFPIQVLGPLGTPEVVFKNYGVEVAIEPFIDKDNNIRTSIYAEVSTLDLSSQNGGVPGLLTRNVESVLNLKSEDTIVISGLASAEHGKQVSKVPYLGDVPIVKNLFRSTSTINRNTELVIFMTPHVTTPDSEWNQELLYVGQRFHDKFKDSGLNPKLME